MKKLVKPRTAVGLLVLVVLALAAVGLSSRFGPSDCTAVETYDARSGSCYYDCTSDEDCAAKAKAVDDQLNGFFEGAQTKVTKPSDRQSAPLAPSTTDETKLLTKSFTGSDTKGTIYTVSKQLALVPTPTKSDKVLWDLFSRVVGKADLARYIQSFEVFDDGNSDSAASVWASQTTGKWHVNVNAAYKDDKKDLVHTMVHEYGHIVSLNSTQLQAEVTGACPNLQLAEGCANQGSYINAFYNQFWQQYGGSAPANDGQDTNEVNDFYSQHKSSFVSGYAATNYGEDWAESWATFVTSSPAKGTQEKDKKVQFFYGYPVLLTTRDRIRVQITSMLQN